MAAVTIRSQVSSGWEIIAQCPLVTSIVSAPIRSANCLSASGGITWSFWATIDLVYAFAITQLAHLLLADLSVDGVARAAFLLVVVWWAWIYTTWMANWFDPLSPLVATVLSGG